MKRIAALLIGLALAVGSAPAVVHAGGNATLWFSPQTFSVKTGEIVTVTLAVNPNGESLDTVRADVSFSAGLLEVTGFQLGSLFPYVTPGNNWNNAAGTLSEGGYVYGTPVTQSGTFGTITFRALSSGTAALKIMSTSKLIYQGEEKINGSSLGTASVSITGTTVAPTQSTTSTPTTATTATSTPTSTTSSSSTTTPTGTVEEQALAYFGALAGRMPSSSEDWAADHCIAYDNCKAATQNVTREQQALSFFIGVMGRTPSATMDWYAIHAIAYTNVFVKWETPSTTTEPTTSSSSTTVSTPTASPEEQALVYFGALAGRMPSSSEDWAADHCIAYDNCKAVVQDATKEAKALDLFGAKYGRMPSATMDWYAVHAIAYTNVFIDWEASAVTTLPEEVPVATTSTTTGTIEDQALVYFGALAGRMPSSSEDWAADHCIAYDNCKAVVQDATKEAKALEKFVAVFGRMPAVSMDWYAIHAIAYTNVFIDWDTATAAAAATTEPQEAPVVTASPEEQALVYFGALAGRMPSSSEDWAA
ncbi:MAG TPA: cohesin domain-containing protein, partial [Patescibacteria group bacterium]|nr:cohesin domain-containing protein [Patescibacteria group bacterium]